MIWTLIRKKYFSHFIDFIPFFDLQTQSSLYVATRSPSDLATLPEIFSQVLGQTPEDVINAQESCLLAYPMHHSDNVHCSWQSGSLFLRQWYGFPPKTCPQKDEVDTILYQTPRLNILGSIIFHNPKFYEDFLGMITLYHVHT